MLTNGNRVDKAFANIMESLLRLEARLDAGLKHIDGRLASLEGAPCRFSVPDDEYTAFAPDAESGLKQEEEMDVWLPALDGEPTGPESPPPSAKPEPVNPITPSQYTALEAIEIEQADAAASPVAVVIPADEDDDDEIGEDIRPGKPSIPVNHTTPAARLLLVPSIRKLANGLVVQDNIKWEKYPVLQEAKRGVLRLYGREGVDRPPGYEREPLADFASESTLSDTNSDVSSPAGEEWGQVGGLTPLAEDNFPPVPQRTVIDLEGLPDFGRETVLSYVDSYNKHLNSIHPILIPRHLNALVDTFLRSIPASGIKPGVAEGVADYASNMRGPTASFVRSSRNPESPGQKRKRSPVTMADSPEMQGISDLKPGHPFRSIATPSWV